MFESIKKKEIFLNLTQYFTRALKLCIVCHGYLKTRRREIFGRFCEKLTFEKALHLIAVLNISFQMMY